MNFECNTVSSEFGHGKCSIPVAPESTNPRSLPFELGEAAVNVVSVPVGTGPMASSMALPYPDPRRAFGQSKLQSQCRGTFSDAWL